MASYLDVPQNRTFLGSAKSGCLQLVNTSILHESNGFGNSHAKFGVLLAMHAWVMTVSKLIVQIFLATLTLVHISSKKICP